MQGVSLITDANGTPAVLTIDLRTLAPDNSPLVAGLLEKIAQEVEASERDDWRLLAHTALNRSYGDDEPDYSDIPAMTAHNIPAP